MVVGCLKSCGLFEGLWVQFLPSLGVIYVLIYIFKNKKRTDQSAVTYNRGIKLSMLRLYVYVRDIFLFILCFICVT